MLLSQIRLLSPYGENKRFRILLILNNLSFEFNVIKIPCQLRLNQLSASMSFNFIFLFNDPSRLEPLSSVFFSHVPFVLEMICRRSNSVPTGPQGSQLQSQSSQQSFSQGLSSQHGMFSQLSQNSLNEVLTNDQV